MKTKKKKSKKDIDQLKQEKSELVVKYIGKVHYSDKEKEEWKATQEYKKALEKIKKIKKILEEV